jgi:hypothetical protein
MVADNDDDGESAAGGRIAHLLQILVRSAQALRAAYAAPRYRRTLTGTLHLMVSVGG